MKDAGGPGVGSRVKLDLNLSFNLKLKLAGTGGQLPVRAGVVMLAAATAAGSESALFPLSSKLVARARATGISGSSGY